MLIIIIFECQNIITLISMIFHMHCVVSNWLELQKNFLKCLTLLMKVYTLLRHGVELSTSVTSRLNFQNYLCHDYSRKLEIKQ